MAAAPAVDFACEHGAGRAPEQQVAADPPPWERRENEEVVFFKATFKGFICKSFHVPEQRLWGNSHWVRVAAKLDGKPRFMPYFSLLNPSFAGLKSQQPSAHSWASPRQR